MATVSELKERARALELDGQIGKALAIYQHVLKHLEGKPALVKELALYVKTGDLLARMDKPSQAIGSYEKAAEQYARHGSAGRIRALIGRIQRAAPERAGLHLLYARRLLEHGHIAASRDMLADHAEAAGLDRTLDALTQLDGRPDDAVRPVLQELMASAVAGEPMGVERMARRLSAQMSRVTDAEAGEVADAPGIQTAGAAWAEVTVRAPIQPEPPGADLIAPAEAAPEPPPEPPEPEMDITASLRAIPRPSSFERVVEFEPETEEPGSTAEAWAMDEAPMFAHPTDVEPPPPAEDTHISTGSASLEEALIYAPSEDELESLEPETDYADSLAAEAAMHASEQTPPVIPSDERFVSTASSSLEEGASYEPTEKSKPAVGPAAPVEEVFDSGFDESVFESAFANDPGDPEPPVEEPATADRAPHRRAQPPAGGSFERPQPKKYEAVEPAASYADRAESGAYEPPVKRARPREPAPAAARPSSGYARTSGVFSGPTSVGSKKPKRQMAMILAVGAAGIILGIGGFWGLVQAGILSLGEAATDSTATVAPMSTTPAPDPVVVNPRPAPDSQPTAPNRPGDGVAVAIAAGSAAADSGTTGATRALSGTGVSDSLASAADATGISGPDSATVVTQGANPAPAAAADSAAGAVRPGAAPVGVPLIVDGLAIESISGSEYQGMSGFRIVQVLDALTSITVESYPTDSVGATRVGIVIVPETPSDTIVGVLRLLTHMVFASAPIPEDSLRALMARLVAQERSN